jgi:desampylase
MWVMQVAISRQQQQILLQWAEVAKPAECCGLVFGRDGHVESVQLTANVASDPNRNFEIDPARLIAAMRSMRDGGPEIIGHFHSHPTGQAEPSKRDLDAAFNDGRIWFIIGIGEICAWKIVPDSNDVLKFVELAMRVEG